MPARGQGQGGGWARLAMERTGLPTLNGAGAVAVLAHSCAGCRQLLTETAGLGPHCSCVLRDLIPAWLGRG